MAGADLEAVAGKLSDFISARAKVTELQQRKAEAQSVVAKINDDLNAAQETLRKVVADLRAAGL